MTWWYENEEELSLEIMDYDKGKGHYRPIKESKMEFDKSRCFTSLNADELKQGDKVITARCMADLKTWVEADAEPNIIERIQDETNTDRFTCKCHGSNKTYDCPLAYLVERKENCTNCEEAGKEGGCRRHGEIDKILCCDCYTPKTEQKAEEKNCYNCRFTYTRNGVMRCMMNDQRCNNPEVACNHYEPTTFEKHYRPFRDTDELIKVFCEKTPKIYDKDDEKLFMPYIWVRNKSDSRVWLITEFNNRILDYLFTNCEFLDGSPCGVEEQ